MMQFKLVYTILNCPIQNISRIEDKNTAGQILGRLLNLIRNSDVKICVAIFSAVGLGGLREYFCFSLRKNIRKHTETFERKSNEEL